MVSAILKLYRNPIKFQVMALVIGTSFGYYYGVYNSNLYFIFQILMIYSIKYQSCLIKKWKIKDRI